MSYWDTLYKYAKLRAEEVIDGRPQQTALKILENKLLDFNRPKNFKPGDKENVLIIMEKSYQKTLFAFNENNIHDAREFSMFQFRTAIEMLKERNEAMKKDLEKSKQNT